MTFFEKKQNSQKSVWHLPLQANLLPYLKLSQSKFPTLCTLMLRAFVLKFFNPRFPNFAHLQFYRNAVALHTDGKQKNLNFHAASKKIGYAGIDVMHQDDLKNSTQNLHDMTSAVNSNHDRYEDFLIYHSKIRAQSSDEILGTNSGNENWPIYQSDSSGLCVSAKSPMSTSLVIFFRRNLQSQVCLQKITNCHRIGFLVL